MKQIMLHLNILPKNLKEYTGMDEKGCRLSLHKSPAVLAQKRAKRVHITANEHCERVTVVACGIATGTTILPMIIFKEKRMKPEFADSLPPCFVCQMSLNDDAFIYYLDSSFCSVQTTRSLFINF